MKINEHPSVQVEPLWRGAGGSVQEPVEPLWTEVGCPGQELVEPPCPNIPPSSLSIPKYLHPKKTVTSSLQATKIFTKGSQHAPGTTTQASESLGHQKAPIPNKSKDSKKRL